MRIELFSELVTIGYEISLKGETIKLQYQKPGDPPELARQLIDELRKYKAEAVNILKTGNTITPSMIVEPEAPVDAIWVNPHNQGTQEARKESLHQVMMAIWEPTFDRVAAIWPRGFVSTQDISSAELEIERVQALVLSGKGRLADFSEAVSAWERACTKEVGNKVKIRDLYT